MACWQVQVNCHCPCMLLQSRSVQSIFYVCCPQHVALLLTCMCSVRRAAAESKGTGSRWLYTCTRMSSYRAAAFHSCLQHVCCICQIEHETLGIMSQRSHEILRISQNQCNVAASFAVEQAHSQPIDPQPGPAAVMATSSAEALALHVHKTAHVHHSWHVRVSALQCSKHLGSMAALYLYRATVVLAAFLRCLWMGKRGRQSGRGGKLYKMLFTLHLQFCVNLCGTLVSMLCRVESADVAAITALFFLLVLMAATQDIAVDGWALTLLARNNVG